MLCNKIIIPTKTQRNEFPVYDLYDSVAIVRRYTKISNNLLCECMRVCRFVWGCSR